MNTTKVAIIGCGNIAEAYAEDLNKNKELALVGVCDIDRLRAEKLAQQNKNCKVYKDLKALLSDSEIEIVINLTVATEHYKIIKTCLEAEKHVYTEKPITIKYEHAKKLVQIAKNKRVELGCSPFTFMNPAQQTALRALKPKNIGTLRLVYAEVNWARIETWHPEPNSFYEVGPLFDVGVYPLMLLTAFLGPVRKVSSFGKIIMPQRKNLQGKPFPVKSSDFVVTMLELASGELIRLTTNFYVGHYNKQGSGIEFHGDKGSVYLESWFFPNAKVQKAKFSQRYENIRIGEKRVSSKLDWTVGIADMARAIKNKRSPRANGEQGAHIVEILEAAKFSMENDGVTVEIESNFVAPKAVKI